MKSPLKSEQLLEEIREANMTYLFLAQRMIREDKAQAMYRLGISEDIATIIDELKTGQILKMAATNLLMCRFRFDDRTVWNLLTGQNKDRGIAGAHAAILMAGQMAAAA